MVYHGAGKGVGTERRVEQEVEWGTDFKERHRVYHASEI